MAHTRPTPLISAMLSAALALVPVGIAAGQGGRDSSSHPGNAESRGKPKAQRTPKHHQFPAGTVGRLTPNQVDSLRVLLAGQEQDWAKVRELYYGEAYLPSLPDIIVYIDSANTIRQAIIRGGKELRNRVLRGEKYIYVRLFTEIPLDTVNRDSAKTVPQTVAISRTAVDYRTDPFLVTVLKGFGSKLFGAAPEPRSSTVADTGIQVALSPIGTGEKTKRPLYSGMARLPLAEETWNRVHISGARGWEIRGGTTVVTNFGNAGRSLFGLSVAGGATFDATMRTLKDSTLVPTGDEVRVNLYLFSHLYLRRPSLPWSRWSVGLSAGTNLGGELLNDLVAGVSVGRLIGDMGLIVGVNALPTTVQDGTKKRERKWFAAIDFHL